MNVQSITCQTDLYNLHSHTHFCDGKASMQEIAEAAHRVGMLHLGFTPHSPIACHSTCNMVREAVDPYLSEIARLRDIHGEQMQVWQSMEIDYLSRDFGPHIDYFQRLPLDYRLASVHFVPNYDGIPIDCDGRYERFSQRLKEEFRGDIRYVVEKFFEHTLTMIELGGFDILGHFDKIARNASQASPGIEEESWYEALIDDVISHAISAQVAIEVNTKAYDEHKRFFPSQRWMDKVIASGLPIVVNSDVHHPDKVNAGRNEALKLIRSLK